MDEQEEPTRYEIYVPARNLGQVTESFKRAAKFIPAFETWDEEEAVWSHPTSYWSGNTDWYRVIIPRDDLALAFARGVDAILHVQERGR